MTNLCLFGFFLVRIFPSVDNAGCNLCTGTKKKKSTCWESNDQINMLLQHRGSTMLPAVKHCGSRAGLQVRGQPEKQQEQDGDRQITYLARWPDSVA